MATIKEQAKVWKDLVPACGDLKNENLLQRHWEKLEGLVGFKFERDPETWSQPFSLGAFMQKNITQFKDEIQHVSTEGRNSKSQLATEFTMYSDYKANS